MTERNAKQITKGVILAYFSSMSKTLKSYSTLRRTVIIKENIWNHLQYFSFGFPPLSIVFHYFSKLFSISIECESDVNMK
jgi:hypothetical protein